MRSYLSMVSVTATHLLRQRTLLLLVSVWVTGPIAAVGAPALLVIGGAFLPFAVSVLGASSSVKRCVSRAVSGQSVISRIGRIPCVHICV